MTGARSHSDVPVGLYDEPRASLRPLAADTTTSPAQSLPALILAMLCDRELQQPSSSSTPSVMAKAEKGEALLLLLGRFCRGPLSAKPLCSSSALAVGFVATSSMDGAWVGTWRHHCPHGPIMAQFTSLGPKYSISGTTGKTTIARGGVSSTASRGQAGTAPFSFAPSLHALSCSKDTGLPEEGSGYSRESPRKELPDAAEHRSGLSSTLSPECAGGCLFCLCYNLVTPTSSFSSACVLFSSPPPSLILLHLLFLFLSSSCFFILSSSLSSSPL